MFRTYVFLLSLMLSGSALAFTSADHHFVIGVSAGPTWVTGNQQQTINLEPDVTKTYTANDSDSTFASGGLFVGCQHALIAAHQPLLGQLGVSIESAGSAKLRGDIWEDGDPDFDNFNYKYKVHHTHVVLQGRLVGNYHTFFQPYFLGGVGVGFNDAHAFTIYPNISEEVAAPGFKSHTTTTFTYTLGIGLQTLLWAHLQAALGYEFADWGKVQLSRAPGQTTGHGVGVNHLYAHQLQFSLFYTV